MTRFSITEDQLLFSADGAVRLTISVSNPATGVPILGRLWDKLLRGAKVGVTPSVGSVGPGDPLSRASTWSHSARGNWPHFPAAPTDCGASTADVGADLIDGHVAIDDQ